MKQNALNHDALVRVRVRSEILQKLERIAKRSKKRFSEFMRGKFDEIIGSDEQPEPPKAK